MATKLEKQITREAEIDGTMYHVSLTPDPEPSITFREKGTRGKGTSLPLKSLLKQSTKLDEPIKPKNIGDVYMTAAEVKSKVAVSNRDYKEKVAVLAAIDDMIKLAEWESNKNAPDTAIIENQNE
tara:strand:- start:1583 stop:1957 length:375 start_codon:yes stop_codon:yes gene_type:complete